MSNAKVIVRNSRAIIQPTGWNTDIAEKVGDAVQRAEDAADTAEGALEQIEDIASGAPDAPSVVNKANRNGDNLTAGQAEDFRAAIGADITDVTRAGIATLEPPAFVTSIRTTGYAEPGDGGGAQYARAVSEPAHPGKAQSADGSWWVLVDTLVTPEVFGGQKCADFAAWAGGGHTPDLPDSISAIRDAIEYLTEIGGGVLAIPGYYYGTDYLPLEDPAVEVVGIGVGRCGLRFKTTGRLNPTIHVQDVRVRLTQMDIMADDDGGAPAGDVGHNGTCFTVGNFFDLNPQPEASANVHDVRLLRRSGSRVGHAFCLIGNVTSFRGHNIVVDGETGQSHNFGFLVHWGAQAAGAGQPITESYHPDDIYIPGLRAFGCARAGAISAACNISMPNAQFENTLAGLRLMAGDETDTYAANQFAGRAYGVWDLRGWKIKGLNSDDNGEALKVVGRGTSKIVTDTTDAFRYYQPTFNVINVSDWEVELDDGSLTEYHIDIDSARLNAFSADNWSAKGLPTTGEAVHITRTRGQVSIQNGYFDGRLDVLDSENPDVSGTTFNAGVISAGSRAAELTGRTHTATTDGDVAASATSISLASPGFGYIVMKDDPIITPGGVVYATDIINAGVLTVPVTAVPAAFSDGATIVLDNLTTGGLGSPNLEGGEYGLYADGVKGFNLTGGRCDRFGTTGHHLLNVTGKVSGVIFENGGLGRIANGSLVTTNVDHGAGSKVEYEGCHYGLNAPYIRDGLRSEAGALGGSHRNGIMGDYITNQTAFTTPSNAAIELHDVVLAATGARITPNTPKAWSPVLKIGSTTPTQSASNAVYVLIEPGLVFFNAIINVTDLLGGTGTVTIEGLPFSGMGSANVGPMRTTGMNALTGRPNWRVNGAVLALEMNDATGDAALTEANLTTSTNIRISGTYRRA